MSPETTNKWTIRRMHLSKRICFFCFCGGGLLFLAPVGDAYSAALLTPPPHPDALTQSNLLRTAHGLLKGIGP